MSSVQIHIGTVPVQANHTDFLPPNKLSEEPLSPLTAHENGFSTQATTCSRGAPPFPQFLPGCCKHAAKEGMCVCTEDVNEQQL